ncbi:hypothetical protein AQUCO_02600386v1 [Aquilegia coerulea]|uniref:Uncharacterized protein n=1 Tax=Aquilegia coerulea TaxID=218851 RepID=A0A2G5D8R0_AQUCA|nr:hypothetical protein AQUCO_02600386v1 [Aquilegia coerulea]
MRFLKRIAGIFGFHSNEEEEETAVDHHPHQNQHQHQHNHHRGDKEEPRRPTKGFSVQVPVAVDRLHFGPIITRSTISDGGVQGLRWYAKRLRIDEDGDVADEFLDEIVPEVVEMSSNIDDQRPSLKFEVKYRTRPAKVKRQVIIDGKIQQSVEHQGRLLWV